MLLTANILNEDTDRLMTTKDELMSIQGQVGEFLPMMEFQIAFGDVRWLNTVKRECAGFLRLALACKERERGYNDTRGPAPTTWDPKAAVTMYYRTRPPVRERDT